MGNIFVNLTLFIYRVIYLKVPYFIISLTENSRDKQQARAGCLPLLGHYRGKTACLSPSII